VRACVCSVLHYVQTISCAGKYVVMVYGTTVQRLLSFSLIVTGDFAVAVRLDGVVVFCVVC
jgi:hypothetical protein